jgi:hypothetical protein
MMFQWRLPEGSLALGEQRVHEAVLVELDGPQLVVARDSVSGKRFLGLFADRDSDGSELWLYAETSDLELEALHVGAVSMLNAVCKNTLDLVEYKEDRPRAVWSVKPEDVPTGVFPVPNAKLPIVARGAQQQVGPVFRCGGRPVRDATISFGALAGIAGAIQSFWGAIAASLFQDRATSQEELVRRAESATLRMGVPVYGSFGIVVASNRDDVFHTIAGHYGQLVGLSPGQISASTASAHVLQTYGLYLKTIADFGAEVFAQLGETEAYIGASIATRLHASMHRVLSAPQVEAQPSTSIARQGFFHAADINKKSFVFFDSVSNQEIYGKISEDVAGRLRERGGEIAVGNRTMYDVQIEIGGVTRAGRERKPVLAQLYEASGPIPARSPFVVAIDVPHAKKA